MSLEITADPSGPSFEELETGPNRILVVDDEVGIRKGCRRILKSEGHEVIVAETAEAGLKALREEGDVDVALVDLRMPGMGGLEFLPKAKKLAPQMVCIVITAYATLETAVEATKRDAFDFLTKPFSPAELLRVVNRALERSRLIKERNRLRADRESRLLQLATEQSRLRTIIDCMGDAVLVCNAEQVLVLHNPRALRVLPHLRRSGEIRKLGEVVEPAELFEIIREVSESRKRLSKEVELTHLEDGGWVLANCAPVVDERSAKILGTVTVLQDITEMKRVEQVKAQFVNMVAHELRSPLAAIDGYLSILMKDMVEDPAEQEQIMGRCRERVKGLVTLVNDLLDVARMEGGRVHREILPRSIGEVAEEVVGLMTPLAEEKGVTLDGWVADDLPTVEADREELIRLLTNLVSNAIKYN
ncbi:MAG: response regulator, partial [Armatimonadia bacterium]|nr:response regulator [Armatimonadia bacterium]